ncbi:MAG: ribonuclease J [bacterium]|nr:ribonuclease J [bacterium]MDZ4231721.1 ribonuclease J [Candidatus Pacearchaeota archaeon]
MAQQKRDQDVLLTPLGGLGEVGRNMMVLEYGDSCIVIDMGFRMPEEDMPGIDYIIPNISYLKENKKKVLAVLITHGHYDHIGAIPYHMGEIGNPPIYAGDLARAIILKRQEDFPNKPKLNFIQVKNKSTFTIGPFKIEAFRQNHNIPDNYGYLIGTPVGNIVHTSDFKFDEDPVNEPATDFPRLEEIGKQKVHLLLSDSTNAEQAGHSLSERIIMENLEEIFKEAKGRIITATFASLINRLQQIVTLSEKYGRKVILEGYSLKTNVEVSRQLGYMKIKKGTVISAKDVHKYPDSKITVMATGAQGEERAVLMRIATKEHQHIQLQKGDTVIFSSSVIPGNERTVQFVKDHLYRQGAKVFHYKMMDIHASGHANQEDLKTLFALMKPKFFTPIHGQFSMLVRHGEIAQECGIPEKNIAVIENGQQMRLSKTGIEIEKKTVPSSYIMVDGLGVGDVGEVVLRDRQNLAADGMFVIIAVVDRKTGRVKGSPDIISRGFIYLKESRDILRETRRHTVSVINKTAGSGGAVNWIYVRDNVKKKVADYLFAKTKRKPMVLPVIIEV